MGQCDSVGMADWVSVVGEYYCFGRIAVVDDTLISDVQLMYGIGDLFKKRS